MTTKIKAHEANIGIRPEIIEHLINITSKTMQVDEWIAGSDIEVIKTNVIVVKKWHYNNPSGFE